MVALLNDNIVHNCIIVVLSSDNVVCNCIII